MHMSVFSRATGVWYHWCFYKEYFGLFSWYSFFFCLPHPMGAKSRWRGSPRARGLPVCINVFTLETLPDQTMANIKQQQQHKTELQKLYLGPLLSNPFAIKVKTVIYKLTDTLAVGSQNMCMVHNWKKVSKKKQGFQHCVLNVLYISFNPRGFTGLWCAQNPIRIRGMGFQFIRKGCVKYGFGRWWCVLATQGRCWAGVKSFGMLQILYSAFIPALLCRKSFVIRRIKNLIALHIILLHRLREKRLTPG